MRCWAVTQPFILGCVLNRNFRVGDDPAGTGKNSLLHASMSAFATPGELVKVFLSSTFRDLQVERDAALCTLQKYQFTAVAMELLLGSNLL